MRDLGLILFDVDGTLVNSQGHILMGMDAAFESQGMPVPPAPEILARVGLSLPVFFRDLVPTATEQQIEALVEGYKNAFVSLRVSGQGDQLSPLYPGIAEMLDACEAHPHWLLGVATGKSRRGLDHLIKAHDWSKRFVTLQCADDHPSKPHPSMVSTAMAEAGVEAGRCVVVGDTTYDMEMAGAAGAHAIGVSWGYHGTEALLGAGAACIVQEAREIVTAVADLLGEQDG